MRRDPAWKARQGVAVGIQEVEPIAAPLEPPAAAESPPLALSLLLHTAVAASRLPYEAALEGALKLLPYEKRRPQ